MVEFKKFVDAFAEVYDLQHQERSLVINNAIRHLSNLLLEVGDFRAICNYLDEFMEHYNNMKEHHLEEEIHNFMKAGDSFFIACREWDI